MINNKVRFTILTNVLDIEWNYLYYVNLHQNWHSWKEVLDVIKPMI